MSFLLAVLSLLFLSSASPAAAGDGPACSQGMVESAPPASRFFLPRVAVPPFYQWNSNNGYCGEVSLMQAGLNQGEWMSQFNARLICGAGLSQSGPEGFCAAHSGNADQNSQLLLEPPLPGDSVYASAPLCLENAKLAAHSFDAAHEAAGLEGFRQYLSWVKAELIQGNQVTIGVLASGGTDPQYDHIVTVTKIGTNHGATDPAYYDDDVLYFEDHGEIAVENFKLADEHPALPLGLAGTAGDCNPYIVPVEAP